MRGKSGKMEAKYTRLSTASEEGAERKAWVQRLFRDNRVETFLMLARLLYIHKLIYEEEEEEVWQRMLGVLEALQARARDDYKCRRLPWIMTLSKPLDTGSAGDEIRKRPSDEIKQRLFAIWEELDLTVIDLMIYMCGEHAQVFLHALCLKVQEPVLRRARVKWRLETRWQPCPLEGMLVPARVEGWQGFGTWADISKKAAKVAKSGRASAAPREGVERKEEEDEEEEEEEEEEKQEELQRSCFGACGFPGADMSGWINWRAYAPRRVESELYFTLRHELISGVGQDRTRFDHLHFLQSMLRCPAAVFATPLGYASIQRCWRHTAWKFVCLRSLDTLYLLALCIFILPVAHKSHSEEPAWPEMGGIICIALLSLRSLVFLVLELCMALEMAGRFGRRFPPHHVRRLCFAYFRATYLNPFTVVCVAVEIWSSVFSFYLVQDSWLRAGIGLWGGEERLDVSSFIQDTILYRRPVMLCCLLLAKWAQLMLQLMTLQGLLKPLLPAWHALKSQTSLTVLAGFILLCVGTANGYYALPVTGGHKEGFRNALFIMFRLNLMGDFDEDELMAGTQKQAATAKGSKHARRVDEMYFALKGFTILCTLAFTVFFLNVYVGVLSAKYNEAQQQRLDWMGRFRAIPAFRIHLCTNFVRKWLPLSSGGGLQEEPDMGFWILLPKNHLPDPSSYESLRWEEWTKT